MMTEKRLRSIELLAGHGTETGNLVASIRELQTEVAELKAEVERLRHERRLAFAEVERRRRGQEAWDAVEKHGMWVQYCRNGQWHVTSYGHVAWCDAHSPIDAALSLRNEIEAKGKQTP